MQWRDPGARVNRSRLAKTCAVVRGYESRPPSPNSGADRVVEESGPVSLTKRKMTGAEIPLDQPQRRAPSRPAGWNGKGRRARTIAQSADWLAKDRLAASIGCARQSDAACTCTVRSPSRFV